MRVSVHSMAAAIVTAVLSLSSAIAAGADTRGDVACAQSYLSYMGFDAGEADGRVGPQTRAAVSAMAAEGAPAELADIEHLGMERICEVLARKVAERDSHPETIFKTDIFPNSAVLISVRLGIDAARNKLKSDAFTTVYGYANDNILRGVSRSVLGKKSLGAWGLESKFVGLADKNTIVLRLKNPMPAGFAKWVGAHEFVHVFQHERTGRHNKLRSDGNLFDGPKWLAEGTAEYVARQVTGIKQSRSKIDYIQLRDISKPRDFNVAVRFLEGQDAYLVSLRAVNYLVGLAGEQKVLFDYWDERGKRGKEERWETTFERVFGISVKDFYGEF